MINILVLSILACVVGFFGIMTVGAGAEYEKSKPSEGYLWYGMFLYAGGVSVAILGLEFWRSLP